MIYYKVYDAVASSSLLIHIDIDFPEGLAMSCSEYNEKNKKLD